MSDYERIAEIIRYLDEHQARQPSIEELASVASLSGSHFHRLFHRWAGITPKDFLQCLTAAYAKRRLRESASVLEATLDAGLSGPGRLHDLMVTLEAASPGEIKSRGAGLEIQWGIADSPFGPCTLGWNTRGICFLAFEDQPESESPPADFTEDWAAAAFVRKDSEAHRRCAEIFRRNPERSLELRAFVRGTPFQVQVWRALLRIPAGCLASYRSIARAVGRPAAVRAVGGACGGNPVAFLVPCHRVIRETGVVNGYHWGSTRKRAMLAWESAPAAPA
jgi:AraC family transcriptional regulator, regulatory protein of adaptative response / methylated-DNA-[protein]-cysteine methyltransferase